jgi:hypothetical protein
MSGLNDHLRQGQPIETRHIHHHATGVPAEIEARLANVEAWIPHLQAGMVGPEHAKAIGEALAESADGLVVELEAKLKRLNDELREKIEVETAIVRSDLADKIDVGIFGGTLADEGLEHLKLAEKAVREVRKETAAAASEVRAAVADMTAKLRSMEMQLRRRDQAKAALVQKLAQEHAGKVEFERALGARVAELEAANANLRADFESLVEALEEQKLVRPNEPMLLEHLAGA